MKYKIIKINSMIIIIIQNYSNSINVNLMVKLTRKINKQMKYKMKKILN